MMAFVHHKMSIVADQIQHIAPSTEALDQCDIYVSLGFPLTTTDHANSSRPDIEKCLESSGPLIEKLLSMNQNERVSTAPGNQVRGDYRLSKSCGRRQNTSVVRQQCSRCNLLFERQFANELDAERCSLLALVAYIDLDPEPGQEIDGVVETTPWQGDVLREEFSTGNDPRLAKGRKPHCLRRIKLGVLERGETDQAIG